MQISHVIAIQNSYCWAIYIYLRYYNKPVICIISSLLFFPYSEVKESDSPSTIVRNIGFVEIFAKVFECVLSLLIIIYFLSIRYENSSSLSFINIGYTTKNKSIMHPIYLTKLCFPFYKLFSSSAGGRFLSSKLLVASCF